MAMKKREFRKRDSFIAEKVTRGEVAAFLETRGFKVEGDKRLKTGTAESQYVTATDQEGKQVTMHVRLC